MFFRKIIHVGNFLKEILFGILKSKLQNFRKIGQAETGLRFFRSWEESFLLSRLIANNKFFNFSTKLSISV